MATTRRPTGMRLNKAVERQEEGGEGRGVGVEEAEVNFEIHILSYKHYVIILNTL